MRSRTGAWMFDVPPTTPVDHTIAPAARVHRMRVARGACWVIVAAVAGAGMLILADAATRLSGPARGFGLACWLTGTGVLVWRFVARPFAASPPDKPGRHAREELPLNLTAATTAAVSLAGCLLGAAFLPGVGEHIRRVAQPWARSAATQYRVTITSGEPVVRRGDTVTLSAYVERLDSAASEAQGVTLVCRSGHAAEERFPMTADSSGVFHFTRVAPADFEYCVEVGSAASEWRAVAAIDPAVATDESQIEIAAPRYALAVPPRIVAGFAHFTGLQFGSAALRLRFDRPPATAFLEWRADGESSTELTPVALAADRTKGSATIRLRHDGTLRLVTVTERNGKSLRTDSVVRVQVARDSPPRFERVVGVAVLSRSAVPGTRVPIEITVTDDIAIGAVVLEYLRGPHAKTVETIPIPLTGSGTTRASGRLSFDLSAVEAAESTVRFRVRVSDTRRLEDPDLKPQDATYPKSGWSELRLDGAARPLPEEDARSQQKQVSDALVSAATEVKDAREEIVSVLETGTGTDSLAVDQTVRLKNAGDRVRKAIAVLRDAGQEAALTPELRPLAASFFNFADSQLGEVEVSLRAAASDGPAQRAMTLAKSRDELGRVQSRLVDARAQNDDLAQTRVDRHRLLELAEAQSVLVNQKSKPADLARQQRELAGRLDRIVAESPALRRATDAAKQSELQRFASGAAKLVADLRDLDAAVRSLEAETRRDLLASVTADQDRLIGKAAALLPGIETAARLANVPAPNPDTFRKVGELVRAGKSLEALTELKSLSTTLDTTAAAFEKVAADRIDPKAAARQLALWQDDIRKRVLTATGGIAAGFDALPAGVKVALRAEQDALRAAVASINLPPGDEVAATHRLAVEHLAIAGRYLAGTGANADAAMAAAGSHLDRLAKLIPTIAERLAKVRAEFAKIQRAQETLAVEADQAVRMPDHTRKLAGLVGRQAQQLTAFAALDLPRFEIRKARLSAALTAATADLKDLALADTVASQEWVKREFDRLKLALDGALAPDDKLEQIARAQAEITKSVASLGPNAIATQLEPHAAAQQELVKQIMAVAIPVEAPGLMNDSRDAAAAAESAFRDKLKHPDLIAKLKTSTAALNRLADRLTGAETDLERVRRIAAARRARLDQARTLILEKKPPDAAASGEAARQLAREAEELANTRVGPAGQLSKKRLLEAFARLKDHPSPDRQSGAQKTLYEGLEELAGLMADVPELSAAHAGSGPAAVASAADAYLPSKSLADGLRGLARDQQSLRQRLSELQDEVARQTKPAKVSPFASHALNQRELADAVTFFARRLEADGEADAARLALSAAVDATLAADALSIGLLKPAAGSADAAATTLWKVAERAGGKMWGTTVEAFAVRQAEVVAGLRGMKIQPSAIAAQHKSRTEQLASRADDLSKSLEIAARDASEETSAGKSYAAAARSAANAGMLLDGPQTVTSGPAAAKIRAEAGAALVACAGEIASLAPAVAVPPIKTVGSLQIGEAVRRAELGLREVLRTLAAELVDQAVVSKVMKKVVRDLRQAASGSVHIESEPK